jgi:hypothetical protein
MDAWSFGLYESIKISLFLIFCRAITFPWVDSFLDGLMARVEKIKDS